MYLPLIFELCQLASSLVIWRVYSTVALSLKPTVTRFAETFLGANRVTRLIRKLIVLMEYYIRLCSDKTICSPNVRRYCPGEIDFCTLQRPISLHCFVCGGIVNAFPSTELFEGIKLRNPLNSIHSSDHTFNALVLVIMRTKVSPISSSLVCIGWTREFSWQYINSDQKVFNTTVVFSRLRKRGINKRDLIDIVSKIFQTRKTFSVLSVNRLWIFTL